MKRCHLPRQETGPCDVHEEGQERESVQGRNAALRVRRQAPGLSTVDWLKASESGSSTGGHGHFNR